LQATEFANGGRTREKDMRTRGLQGKGQPKNLGAQKKGEEEKVAGKLPGSEGQGEAKTTEGARGEEKGLYHQGPLRRWGSQEPHRISSKNRLVRKGGVGDGFRKKRSAGIRKSQLAGLWVRRGKKELIKKKGTSRKGVRHLGPLKK